MSCSLLDSFENLSSMHSTQYCDKHTLSNMKSPYTLHTSSFKMSPRHSRANTLSPVSPRTGSSGYATKIGLILVVNLQNEQNCYNIDIMCYLKMSFLCENTHFIVVNTCYR